MSEGLTPSLFPATTGLTLDHSFVKRTPDSFMRANRDRMSIPVELLTGKSVALTCTDPAVVVACAQIDVHKGLLPEEAWEEVLSRRRLMQRGAAAERILESASPSYSFRGSMEKVPEEAAFLPFAGLNPLGAVTPLGTVNPLGAVNPLGTLNSLAGVNPLGYAESLANQFVRIMQEILNMSLFAVTPKLDLFDGLFSRKLNFMGSLLNV